jgi:hypothetical protein
MWQKFCKAVDWVISYAVQHVLENRVQIGVKYFPIFGPNEFFAMTCGAVCFKYRQLMFNLFSIICLPKN